MSTPKTTPRSNHSPSPEVAAARARLAGMYRHGPRDPNDPKVVEAARELNAAMAADRVNRILDAEPPLTDEQIRRVADLLWSGSKSPRDQGGPVT